MTSRDVRDEVERLWIEARGTALASVDSIDEAARALAAGQLDEVDRAVAERAAHRLAGSLGAYGRPEGTRHARVLEAALATPDPGCARELAERARALRTVVEGEATGAGAAAGAGQAADVVAVGFPPGEAGAFSAAAAERELAVVAVADPDAAGRPSVVLLDGELPGLPDAVSRVAATGAAVVVALRPGSPYDGTDLVRRGARRLLAPGMPPGALAEALAALVPRRGSAGRVLAVDDDPATLLVVGAMLGGAGYDVQTLGDPRDFHAALDRIWPDLVLCDVDMPSVDGVELCRALRADARWRATPLLFLTSFSEPAKLAELFAAGADDYVPKPLVGPDLIARVHAQLDRVGEA